MGVRGDLEAVRERFIEQGLQILSDIPPNRDSLFQLFGCRELLVPFVGAGLSVDHGFPEWKPLLRAAADYMASRTGHDRRSEIDALLDRDQYEEAAEQLEALDSAVFDGFIGTTFSRPGPRYGATRRLPKIAGGLVITTNLDTVIERAFGCVYPVLRGVAIGGLLNRSIQLGEPLILKLHGDHSEPQTRILTQTAYARAYCIGNDVAKGVDPEKPLPKVLARVYGARPLLFLGCSLRADRTTHVLETIMADFEGTEHFALLEEPSPAECDQRLRQLQSWHIRPLFFRRGDFDCIEQFLDVLGNHTSITARATASRTYFLIAPTCPPKNGSYQGRLQAELCREPTFASATALRLSGDPDLYGDSYFNAFESFRSAKDGDWLLTIQPEEGTWRYNRRTEEDIAIELARSGKRVIFFESGGGLRERTLELMKTNRWPKGKKNPFTVIQTETDDAFQRMYRHMLESKLFEPVEGGTTIVLITIPGPCTYAAQQRSQAYQAFLSEIHRAHGLPEEIYNRLRGEFEYPDVCAFLRKAEVRTAATVWLDKWDEKLACRAASSLLGMCDFKNDRCRVLFLCGNDQLALGARGAVLSTAAGRKAVRAGRVAFYGIDGSKKMTDALNAKKIRGFTLFVNFAAMREKATEVVRDPENDTDRILYVLATPWTLETVAK